MNHLTTARVQGPSPATNTIRKKRPQEPIQEPLDVYYRRKLRECQGSDSIQRLNSITSVDEHRSRYALTEPLTGDSIDSPAALETLEISYRKKLREYEGFDSVDSLTPVDEPESIDTLKKPDPRDLEKNLASVIPKSKEGGRKI